MGRMLKALERGAGAADSHGFLIEEGIGPFRRLAVGSNEEPSHLRLVGSPEEQEAALARDSGVAPIGRRFDVLKSQLPEQDSPMDVDSASEMIDRVIELDSGVLAKLETALKEIIPAIAGILDEMLIVEQGMREDLELHDGFLVEGELLDIEQGIRGAVNRDLQAELQASINDRYGLVRRIQLIFSLYCSVRDKLTIRARRIEGAQAQIARVEVARTQAQKSYERIGRSRQLRARADMIIEKALTDASVQLADLVREVATTEMDLILGHADLVLVAADSRGRLEQEIGALANVRKEELEVVAELADAGLIDAMTVALAQDERITAEQVAEAQEGLFLRVGGSFPKLVEDRVELPVVVDGGGATNSNVEEDCNVPQFDASISEWVHYLCNEGPPHPALSKEDALLRLFTLRNVQPEEFEVTFWEVLGREFEHHAALSAKLAEMVENHPTVVAGRELEEARLLELNRSKYPDCQSIMREKGIGEASLAEVRQVMALDVQQGKTLTAHQIGALVDQFWGIPSPSFFQTVIDHPNTSVLTLVKIINGKSCFGKTPSNLQKIVDHPQANVTVWTAVIESDEILEYMFPKEGAGSFNDFVENLVMRNGMGMPVMVSLVHRFRMKEYLDFKRKGDYVLRRGDGGDFYYGSRGVAQNCHGQIDRIQGIADLMVRLVSKLSNSLTKECFDYLKYFLGNMPVVQGEYGLRLPENRVERLNSVSGLARVVTRISSHGDGGSYSEFVKSLPPDLKKELHLDILRNPLRASYYLRAVYERGFSKNEAHALIDNPTLPTEGLCRVLATCDQSYLERVARHPMVDREVLETLKRCRHFSLEY
jgi:hypothetical protein